MNRGEEEAVSTAPDAGADGGSGSGDEAPMLRRTSKVSFPTTQPASSGDVHSPAHEKILSRKPTPFNQDLAATIKSSGITALLTGEAATAAAAAGDTGAAASPANGDEGAAEDALREQDRGGTETVQEQVNGIGAEESGAAAPVEEE